MDGGCVAMANFLDLLLAGNHEVKHLTVATNKHPFYISNYPPEITQKTSVESVRITTDVKPLKAFLALFKKNSYNVSRFYSDEMNSLVKTALSNEKFDVVILESLFSTVYLDTIRSYFKGKVYLRSHNIEFQIWEDITNNCGNWLKRKYFKRLTSDLKRYELDTIQQLDGILTISTADEQYYKQHLTAPVTTLPFTIAINNTLINDYIASNLFHVGGMDWEPNREAVERLIGLFPSIIKQHPKIELSLIGKGTDELVSNNSSIHAEGFIDDLEAQAVKTGILVSPISAGSGIRIKILEMMALGIPVITTKKGAQGIDYEGKKCLFIADTDEKIIQACVELSTNPSLRSELGKNAKNYISIYHSPTTIAKQLDEFLQST